MPADLQAAGAGTFRTPAAPSVTHILVASNNRDWISVSEDKPVAPGCRQRWTLMQTMWHYGHVETRGRASGNARAKWVVRKQWAVDCLAAGEILPVTAYVLK